MSQAPDKKNSIWNKTKVIGKKNFDKAWDALDKLGPPVNRLTNKLGSEAFWPMTIDKESEKVARILQSFCKDGVYAEESKDSTPAPETKGGKQPIDKPRGKPKVLQKIPAEVIRQAKGLAIFTAMRTGLWFSGAGGSGVLIARVPETGEWSAPSGILLHTAGLGFLVGADIYDCVMVINTYEALEAFTKVRVTLGGEIGVTAGPVGIGGVIESEVHKRRAPIWTYVKSRGFYAGVQIDGTVVIERIDENERFYGRKIPAKEILTGQARTDDPSVKMLTHTIRAAQGDVQFEQTPAGVNMATGPSPSDLQYEDLAGTQMAQVQPPPNHGPQYNTGPQDTSGAQYNAQPPYNVESQHNAGAPYNAGPPRNPGPQPNVSLDDPSAIVTCPICEQSVSSLKINEHIDSNCQNFVEPKSSTGDLTSSQPNHGPPYNAGPQSNAGPYNAGTPYNPDQQNYAGPYNTGLQSNAGPPPGPQNNAGPYNAHPPYNTDPQSNTGPYNAGPYNTGPQDHLGPHNAGPQYNVEPQHSAGPYNAGSPYNPGPQSNAGPYNTGPQHNPDKYWTPVQPWATVQCWPIQYWTTRESWAAQCWTTAKCWATIQCRTVWAS
ncbi:hypothetical protein BDV41DRAFT_560827 [Aspergillus transmontanensis]|uniref:UBZ4-type domain-containing protein n=1 Tax=Aspergillus transmontanensis TaxID=1034304 RepID=A0A5N6WD08_9EURO|nr:hypothetical protein BDV41DRAFT_560827 [Aspergillus transmontanensis]